jgi:Phage portal protein, SPP1 Gp6-like.
MDQKIIDAYITRDAQRQMDVATAWRLYEGDWPEPLRPSDTDPDASDNTIINLVRKVLDKSAGALMGKGADIEIDGEGDTPADEWVKGLMVQNGGERFWVDLATSGAVSGDAYVMLQAPPAGHKYPRLRSLDAQHVTIVTNPLDHEDVTAYVMVCPVDNPASGQIDYYQMVVERGENGFWTISESIREGTYRSNAGYHLVREPVVWPYPWCPIVHAKNLPAPHRAHGTPDLTRDLIRINRAINFLASNSQRVLRLQGHSKAWAKGVPDDEPIDLSPDTVYVSPNDQFEMGYLQADVDIAGHSQRLGEMVSLLYSMSSVPEIAFGKVADLGQLSSGRALEVLYQALVDLTETKRSLYGPLVVEVIKRALDMGGLGYDHEIALHWPPVIDRGAAMTREDVDAALGKTQLGVSRSTILAEYGYDAETEAQKVAAEGAALGSGLLDAFNRGADDGE